MATALRLRTTLVLFLTLTSLATFLVVGAAGIGWRAAQVADEDQSTLAREAGALAERTAIQLGAVERQLEVLAVALRMAPAGRHQALIDAALGAGSAYSVVYLISPAGTVEAIGSALTSVRQPAELVGTDLGANRLYRQARERARTVWSDKYLSALTGQITIGLALPVGERTLIAELPLSQVLQALQIAVGSLDVAVWVVDGGGEVLADSGGARSATSANLATLPVVRAALDRTPLPPTFAYDGRQWQAAAARSPVLDWTFVSRLPVGIDNPRIRGALLVSLLAMAASLVVGAGLAPLWAAWMARPLNQIVQRARDVAAGRPPEHWPRGRVQEINTLAADLELMAGALGEREQKFQALFESSPVGVALCDPQADMALVDLNPRMADLFGTTRAAAIGRNDLALGLWPQAQARAAWWQAVAGGTASVEATLRRHDGQAFECRMLARAVQVGPDQRVVWVCEDVSEARMLARELAALNTELESRVARRTQDLAEANQALSTTVAELRSTQQELVRSEKLAALGSLVAGVAHELNTPIGNALMAVTTLQEQAAELQARLAGPSGSTPLHDERFDAFLRSAGRGTDISHRNLAKAAELVSSFKQVAVDQTTSHRRRFLLDEVVNEVLLTLSPMLKREPVTVHCEIAADLAMDSYPGALGQTLANLIRNALVHAFAPDQPGQIWIEAEPLGDAQLVLSVRDDGQGIEATLRERVFDPFVTSKMGRGGTGLGLHIAHNAVVNVLGGRIELDSAERPGTRFIVTLPRIAPGAAVRDATA